MNVKDLSLSLDRSGDGSGSRSPRTLIAALGIASILAFAVTAFLASPSGYTVAIDASASDARAGVAASVVRWQATRA